MIITRQKPFEQIIKSLEGEDRILILGCGECATVSRTGGKDQMIEMAAELEKNGKEVVGSIIIGAPCMTLDLKRAFRENEEIVGQADSVLIMACGAALASAIECTDMPIHPALNSLFLGNVQRHMNFSENCSHCGECVADETAGVCPVTRCTKSLLNGPCGGAEDGKCEIDSDIPCAWALIYERLKRFGQLEKLRIVVPAKDNSSQKPARLNYTRTRDGEWVEK